MPLRANSVGLSNSWTRRRDAAAGSEVVNVRDALLLGRVSNLPTVWTNVLTGVVLSGVALQLDIGLYAVVALTLFYIGGMYLNDAYDAEIDAIERPERPIPAGRVSRATVFAAGYGMLALGLVLLWLAGSHSGTGWWPVAAGAALGAAIVIYDKWHKANPLSPFVMGACRMLVYVTAAYCLTTALPSGVIIGAVVVLCYLIGLTYVAKQENIGQVSNMWPLVFLAAPIIYVLIDFEFWSWTALIAAVLLAWIAYAVRFVVRAGPGDIPRAVISLIAGICIVDALLIAQTGHMGLALAALVGFVLTLALQRFVPGT